MDLRLLDDSYKDQYDKLVTHVIQSWQWGEFRKQLGLPLLRYGLFEKGELITAFQLTLHKIPFTNKYVGYLPKGPLPSKQLAEALTKIAQEQSCAFIKVEPDVEKSSARLPDGQAIRHQLSSKFKVSPKPLFTKYNFVLDISKSEEELLKNMHSKTRYNIRLAEKKGVKVEEKDDNLALDKYLKLYFETTVRQNYHGHTPSYHKKVFQTLKTAGLARFLIATYKNKPLTAWMLLNFKDTLYYPYGGSSDQYREVMASNLVAWEAIKLGKRLGLKYFDMWGALGPDADPKDPWYGFHKFKQGYGGRLVEYFGTYDLIIDPLLYQLFTTVDRFTKLKVFLLKLIGK